jgi:UDP-2-acetamido-3-amino-2,3-dideoxy-glucuronate N-acetyltransferase
VNKNIAVVGCGHWGKNLVRNFSELGCLYSICDPNAKLAQTFADLYEVNSLSFEQTIADPSVEGVVLAVPAPLHASLALEAMNAGKHVYVEKPLAMNQHEAEKMILSAQKNNVKMMVGHLLQYHPVFISLLSMVRSGDIGSLRYLYSNRLSLGKVRAEEDVIWSFAPHDISMILSLVGEEPSVVSVVSAKILQPDIADTATVHMEFSKGLKSHILVSWLHPYKEQKLVVIGDLAMAVFDDTKPWGEKLAVYRHSVDLSNGTLPDLKKAEVEYVSVPSSEPLRNECQHFIDVVNSGVTPRTDGVEGMQVLKVLSASTLSQTQNIPVKVGSI